MVVIVIITVLAGLLLPALSKARKNSLRRSLTEPEPVPRLTKPETEPGRAVPVPRARATVKSFSATISLKPGLSIGTSEPESIYTAQLTSKFLALKLLGFVDPTKKLNDFLHSPWALRHKRLPLKSYWGGSMTEFNAAF